MTVMNQRGRNLGWALLVGAMAISGDALADPADDKFKAGFTLFEAGQFEAAEALYEEAFALRESPDIAANLAQVKLELGKKAEAAKYLAYALRLMPATADPALRRKLEETMVEVKASVAELRVETSIPGAEISVGGRVVGRSPLADPLYFEPGEVIIRATLNAHEPAEQRVPCATGDAREVRLTLVPSTAGGEPVPVATSERPLWPAFVLGGVAAVGVGLGVVGTIGASGAYSDAEALAASDACSSPAKCRAAGDELASDYGSFGTMGVVGFGVGAAALGAMVIYLVLPESSEPSVQSAVAVTPWVGPTVGGLSIRVGL
jgi:tetratricopeptide (TPR) repeat protein